MRTLKIILMTLIVILTHQGINAQTINAQLHSRFIGYGINELYIYLTLQEDRQPVSQTKPHMRIPVNDNGTFVLVMPKVVTGGYTVRNFMGKVMGIYDNLYVSNESTLTMMDVRANAQEMLSEYFGPCDDSTRGSKIGFYVHATKAVSISGTNLNITFREGWNLMVVDNKAESIWVASGLSSGWNWGTD